MVAIARTIETHSLVRVERPGRRLITVHEPTDAMWHSAVEMHSGCALQSAEWGSVKAESGWQASRVALLEGSAPLAGAQVLFRSTPFGRLAYIPRGPLVSFDDTDATELLMSTVVRLARRNGAIAIRLEPNCPKSPAFEAFVARWRLQVARPVQPRSTVTIDLTASPTEVWERLSARTRYNVRLAGRRGVQILDGEESDVQIFHALLEQTGKRAGFAVHGLDYFQSVWKHFGRQGFARLLFARREGEILAGTLDLDCGHSTYHLYAASSETGREHKPNDLLQWEAMRRAQCEGSAVYDMWGIPDEVGHAWEQGWPEPTTGAGGLWGVYAFKRGFGGEITRFAGAYDLALSPHRHWLLSQTSDRLRWLKAKANSVSAIRRSRVGR
jgi:lipid II:glycine glycyltransferase (peptidoglycan interpeptide bridge formation enzyme)